MNYYDILEVPKSSTTSDIRTAYRRLALKWHPDKNPDNQEEATRKFKQVSEAYEVLSDDTRRRNYDLSQRTGGFPGNQNFNGHTHSRRSSSNFDQNFDDFFSSFSFRTPEEVFREFFRGAPFADGWGHGNRSSHLSAVAEEVGSRFGLNLAGLDFTAFDTAFDQALGSTFASSTSRTSTNMVSNGGGYSSFSSTSTSTRVENGKQITTTKVTKDGVETTTVLENGVLKSRTVRNINTNSTDIITDSRTDDNSFCSIL